VVITQSFVTLSHAPLQCAADSLSALMYWLPASLDIGASVLGRAASEWPDASTIAHIVLPPLITVALLVSVLRSHTPRDTDDTASVPVSLAATLMIVVVLVVAGGEVAYLCGASTSVASMWRGATLSYAAIGYYWWRMFGGGRDSHADDDY